jgi:pimeloyl-ACP methyl ester carboxylesterase
MTREQVFSITYQQDDLSVAANVRVSSDDLIVFLHGFGCAKEAFDRAFTADCLKDFSLCAFDFPGHGASGGSEFRHHSLQGYADIANLVVDRLAPARVFMVCHSMGAAVGLLAAQRRNDISYFANIEGNLVGQDCGFVSRMIAAQSRDVFVDSGYDQFAKTLRESSRRDYSTWEQWYTQADPSALHENARSLVEWSDSGKLLKLFRALECKAYIYGDEDNKEYLLPKLRWVPTYRMPHAGHFLMLDDPDSFYALLADMFQRNLTDPSAPAAAQPRWP